MVTLLKIEGTVTQSAREIKIADIRKIAIDNAQKTIKNAIPDLSG